MPDDSVILASNSSEDPLKRVRYPNIVVSDGYLNDPIKFTVNPNFHEYTSISQSMSYSGSGVVQRDFAEFITIDRNNGASQLLIVNMISPQWRRDAYDKVIGTRAQFTQFGVSP